MREGLQEKERAVSNGAGTWGQLPSNCSAFNVGRRKEEVVKTQSMKLSVVIPFHYMQDWSMYLYRCLKSIERQTFTDYEILLLKYGKAGETHNELFRRAKGDLIKVLHIDDYFTDENSLKTIVDNFGEFDYWQASGCLHDDGLRVFNPHSARYSEDIHTGNNTIGAPSVLTFRNDLGVEFDESLTWLVDCDLYRKFFDKYGPPRILEEFPVTIGVHQGQTTHLISDETKHREFEVMRKRYG